MKQEMFVIATKGRNGKEIYLAVDEERSKLFLKKIFFKWTENIDEAIATFTYSDIEDTAKRYFKNYNKWYIRSYDALFV